MPDENNDISADNDTEIVPSIAPDLMADAATIQPAGNPADAVAIKKLKYRFWLSLFSLFMSGIFGALALLGVAAGYGLANELEGGNPTELVFTFKIITAIMITLAPTCIWVAYKMRPGGD